MINPLPSAIATSAEQADILLQSLTHRKAAWVQVSLADRLNMLQRCVTSVYQWAAVWAEAACGAKGIDPTSPLAGEEWLVGPTVTLANLQELMRSLRASGQPRPLNLTQRHGQLIADIFPSDRMERLLWLGYRGEVWLEPGKPPSQGRIYRELTASGAVALVLGAGNVSSIAPMDALYKLFVENAVVLLKMNPVNEYMGPILEHAFAPLCEAGWLQIVYGGADLGRYLCQHPLIDTIHITGSQATHDAIVWGDPTHKATQPAQNSKPITSELGCVTPVFVVPGNWSRSDLVYQARHVAGMVAHNASFNCAAAKVLVTSKTWSQRQEFLACVQAELAKTPLRAAYYPGAGDRHRAFMQQYPQAIAIGATASTTGPIATSSIASPIEPLPWTLIPDVPPRSQEFALTQEAFCSVLAEVSLETIDAQDFLSQAVSFANQQIWGNLSCTLLIDGKTQQRHAAELEDAIARLRYGAIGINVWSAVLYTLPVFPWGAFPGNSITDIQSGQGTVHNTYLFDYPQKSVLRAPFRSRPLPIWFARHSHLRSLAQHFTDWQANPDWYHFGRVVVAALRG